MNEAERKKLPKKNVMSDMVAAPRRVSAIKNKKEELGSNSRKERMIKKTEEEMSPVSRKDSYHDEVRIASLTSSHSTVHTGGKKMGCAVWLVIVIAMISLTLVIGGLFSRAKIVITPVSAEGAVDTTLILTQSTNVSSKSIPFYTAKKIFTRMMVVSAEKGLSKDGAATGIVRFFNTTSKLITIQAGTKMIVADSGSLTYVTKNSITIPSGSSIKPGQKDGAVVAESIGASYNTLGAHDMLLLTPIEGIRVRSTGAFTGGSTKDDLSADEAALNNAVASLKSEAFVTEDTFRLLAAEAPSDFYMLPIMITDSDRSVSYDYHQDDGIHVMVSQALLGVMVKKTDLAKYLNPLIKAPEGVKMTFDNSRSSIQLTTSAAISPSQVPNTFSVRLIGDVALTGVIEKSAIIDHIKGTSRTEAKNYLSGLFEIKSSDIHIAPFWRRILPLDSEEITITLINP